MKTLSTPEFHAAVQALSPRVAVFDCDGTLWSGDAGSGFMHYTIEEGILSPEKIAWLNQRYELYKAGEVPEVAICGEMVQVYAGLAESTMRAAAARFFEDRIRPNIFPALRHLVASLQEADVEIWAVSSTNNWMIEEGMRNFNIPAARVLAAEVEVAGGTVTERLLAVPTDELKVEALQRVGVKNPDCVFGNSIHDAAMLAIARRAFPVNPTPALAALAESRGWPVYQP